MYNSLVMSVRATSLNPITVDLHQDLVLSPCLFILVMDELARHVQDEVLKNLPVAYDIVSINETKKRVVRNLEGNTRIERI